MLYEPKEEANSGNGHATMIPNAPPNIAPMNKEGLKTPPTNPEPKQITVAISFIIKRVIRAEN